MRGPFTVSWRLNLFVSISLCFHAPVEVVGISFVYNELEVVTGSIDSIFFVWRLPSLVIKQRFARSSSSPLVREADVFACRFAGFFLFLVLQSTITLNTRRRNM